jgi:hypothetical protein
VTSQAEVISPILCEIALNTLEESAIKAKKKIQFTVYANQFICTKVDPREFDEKPNFLMKHG